MPIAKAATHTCEEVKAILLAMTPEEASKAIIAAVEEWPELYDLVVEGMNFEVLDEDGEDGEEDEDGSEDEDDSEDEDED